MTTNRRDFLKTSAAAAAASLAARNVLAMPPAAAPQRIIAPGADRYVEDLALEALNAARDAGASYADVRIGRYHRQQIDTREHQIQGVSDSESYGIGVRTIVNGSWGFAATSTMTKDAVQKVAREAARLSRAARSVQRRPIELAPSAPVKGTWMTPVMKDPFDVPIEDKIGMLLKANENALQVGKVKFVTSGLQLLKEVKTLLTTEGTNITQTFIRVGPDFNATAVGDGEFQSFAEELSPRGQGWEYVLEMDMPGNAEKWASVAAEKLTAKSVDPGRYDLILEPTNMWLTIHESIGHPTELDRAMGYEANFAGTSFLAPPEKMLGKFKYGPEFFNIQGDRTQEKSLSHCMWDDEGVPADKFLIVEKGIFKEYQTTREQASWIAPITGTKHSHGCSFADSWSNVQFQRMPNVSLLPNEKDTTMEEIIAATDHGVIIRNHGSWSIDHQRYNFQFSGQAYHEVKNGKIVGMLKDVAYQANTPVFWNSMDMLGGKASYRLEGAFNDGKGEPVQISSVSHGCPPARFKEVNIVNTGRTG